MTTDKKRKQEVLNSLLRKESWELETIKNDHARAQKVLEQETHALQEANEKLEASILELRQLMGDAASLQLGSLQTMRLYWAEKNREQLAQQSRQQQISSEANAIARQLTRKMRYTQGLEDIESATRKDIDVEREKAALRENEEQWTQRYRKDE